MRKTILPPLTGEAAKKFLTEGFYHFRKKRQREGIEIARQKGKYQGRRPNKELHKKIIECHILNNPPLSIAKTAKLLNTTVSMVTRVCGLYNKDNSYLKTLDE